MNIINEIKEVGILGAGRQAAETAGYLMEQGYKIKFFFCEAKYKSESNPLSKIAPILTDQEDTSIFSDTYVISAVGSPLTKKKLINMWGFNKFTSFIHPQSWIAAGVEIGLDVTISPMAVINTNTTIADHILINTSCSISHDAKIAEYSTVSPGVNIAGSVNIGSGSFIGIGSSIIENCFIGSGVIIAAGAVVIEDIPNNHLVMGVPAKKTKQLNEWY